MSKMLMLNVQSLNIMLAREALVIEVENYIKEYAPSSALSALALVNLMW